MSSEDSYWYIDSENENEAKIQAMCVKCHEKEKFGWYWNGSALGYGDYDLNCNMCGHTIHKRDNVNKTQEAQTPV